MHFYNILTVGQFSRPETVPNVIKHRALSHIYLFVSRGAYRMANDTKALARRKRPHPSTRKYVFSHVAYTLPLKVFYHRKGHAPLPHLRLAVVTALL